jgi:exonuclease III
MAQARKTTEELLAEEEKKSEQLKARMAELKARHKIEERKRDTHRKVLAGAVLISHVKIDPRVRRAVQDAFNIALTDPRRRAVLADLLDETAFNRAMQAATKKAAVEAKQAQETQKQPAPAARPPQQDKTVRGTHGPPLV